MLNVIAGLLSGAGAPASTTSYESIATVTVGGGGSSSISFSSIPSTFKHLQIRGIALTTAGGINIQYNTDTGTNYTYHQIYGTGTAAAANAGINQTSGYLGYNNAAGAPTALVCDILDYSDTNKFTTHRSLSATDVNGAGGAVTYFSGLWRNTAAVSNINIIGTFSQYTSIALYGIKG